MKSSTDYTQADIRRLLEGAQVSLERLLARVRMIPLERKSSGPDRSSFDVWLCRSDARLTDVVFTLNHALTA